MQVEKSSWVKTLLQGGSGKGEILLDWNEMAEQYGWHASFIPAYVIRALSLF